ncbi:hypothetical protein [Streptomyces sp. SID10815]|uniref:hypothetical protein n=1 Tax=Streptomyces sp. SID10815 TaxID=2706027 RepID=UPI0013C993A5|nr:hypothetical protein [Streptomyces sp. SID10815]NEA48454.1 hypothetical protein [Streptomyces sp. SID10815]
MTVQHFGFTWTDPDGTPRASAVAYDKTCADQRRDELETADCTQVAIVPVTPGQLAEPRA